MGLVYRGDRIYFYRTVRRGGRRLTEYVGSGDAAIEAMDQAERKRAHRRHWKRLIAEHDEDLRLRKEKFQEWCGKKDAKLARLKERYDAEITNLRRESRERIEAAKAELAETRRQARKELRAEVEALTEQDARVAALASEALAAAHAMMTLAGFRRHERGEWRRIRGSGTMAKRPGGKTTKAIAGAASAAPAKEDFSAAIGRQVASLEEIAKTNFHEACERARIVLRTVKQFADPKKADELDRAWGFISDPARSALIVGAKMSSDGSALGTTATLMRLEELAEDLQGSEPTPLERMLVGRIVVAYLELGRLDNAAERLASSRNQYGIAMENQVSKLRSRAERRMESLTRTLHLLRTKVPAPVQLSISQTVNQTVNAAEPAREAEIRQPELADVLAGRGRALAN